MQCCGNKYQDTANNLCALCTIFTNQEEKKDLCDRENDKVRVHIIGDVIRKLSILYFSLTITRYSLFLYFISIVNLKLYPKFVKEKTFRFYQLFISKILNLGA